MKIIQRFLTFATITMLLSTSCQYVKVKDHKEKEETKQEQPKLTEEQFFIRNMASTQYMDYATVIGDTAYLGLPSRRGLEHSKDNDAKSFLYDLRKYGKFTHISACLVVNISKDFVWSDTLVSGQIIGYADSLTLKGKRR